MRKTLLAVAIFLLATSTVFGGQPLEYMLACINTNNVALRANHPDVKKFCNLLDTLERRCRNSRKAISDMTVTCYELLNEYGIKITLLETMTELLGFTHLMQKMDPKMLDFTQIAAGYLTARTK